MSHEPSIRRAKHDRENPYVMISKNIFRDPDLSLKAKGLLGYLLSLPDNWNTHLLQVADSVRIGKDCAQSLFKELIDNGYCKKTTQKENGKFSKVVYEFSEEKIFKKTIPQPGFPAPIKSATENPPLLSNESSSLEEDIQNTYSKECAGKADASRSSDLLYSDQKGNITYTLSQKKTLQNKPNDSLVEKRKNVHVTERFHQYLLEKYDSDFIEQCYTHLAEWKSEKTPKEIAKASDEGRLKKWVVNSVRDRIATEKILQKKEAWANSTSSTKELGIIEQLAKLGFTKNSTHNGATLYMDDKGINFQRGNNINQLNFKEHGFMERFRSICFKLGVDLGGQNDNS